MRLLESLDLVADRSVAFNKQNAHTGLNTHSDKMNYVLAGRGCGVVWCGVARRTIVTLTLTFTLTLPFTLTPP